jgi:hypothetical protein
MAFSACGTPGQPAQAVRQEVHPSFWQLNNVAAAPQPRFFQPSNVQFGSMSLSGSWQTSAGSLVVTNALNNRDETLCVFIAGGGNSTVLLKLTGPVNTGEIQAGMDGVWWRACFKNLTSGSYRINFLGNNQDGLYVGAYQITGTGIPEYLS